MPFPDHRPQGMADGQSCGSLTVLCHAMRYSDISDILPPALCVRACKCVHAKILANLALIEQNIDRFGDGGKMGKNTVSF